LISVKRKNRTVLSSVWRTFRQPSRHRRCGTMLSALSTRGSSVWERQSPCSVPATPVFITCPTSVLLVLYLQCTSDMPAYRYLIVQFPINDVANFCELEVYIRRKYTRTACNGRLAIANSSLLLVAI